jgi:hypothetical protein
VVRIHAGEPLFHFRTRRHRFPSKPRPLPQTFGICYGFGFLLSPTFDVLSNLIACPPCDFRRQISPFSPVDRFRLLTGPFGPGCQVINATIAKMQVRFVCLIKPSQTLPELAVDRRLHDKTVVSTRGIGQQLRQIKKMKMPKLVTSAFLGLDRRSYPEV